MHVEFLATLAVFGDPRLRCATRITTRLNGASAGWQLHPLYQPQGNLEHEPALRPGPLCAYYGEFVQLERPKKNGQFGANRTVVFGDAERGGGRDAV